MTSLEDHSNDHGTPILIPHLNRCEAIQRFSRTIPKPIPCELRDSVQGGPSLYLLMMGGYLGASDVTSGL